MKYLGLFLVFLASIALLSPTHGTLISNYQYEGMDGELHYLDNSTYLFIDFFATWCGPCKESSKELITLQAYRGDVIKILSLSVSFDSETPEFMNQFRQENNITWEMGIDPNRTLTSKLEVNYIPSYALLSPQGEVLEFLNATNFPTLHDMIEAVDRHTQSTNSSFPPTVLSLSSTSGLSVLIEPVLLALLIPIIQRLKK